MSPQTFHHTQDEAVISAGEMAKASRPYLMATVFLIASCNCYVVKPYLEGDELQFNCLLIVLANGTQIDPVDYRTRRTHG